MTVVQLMVRWIVTIALVATLLLTSVAQAEVELEHPSIWPDDDETFQKFKFAAQDDTSDDDSSDDFVSVPPAQSAAPPPPPAPVIVWGEEENEVSNDDSDLLDEVVAGQAIVQLRPEVDPYGFASRNGLTVLRVLVGPNIALVQLSGTADDAEEVTALAAGAEVLWGELNSTAQAPEGRPRYFFTSVAGEPRIVEGPALPIGLEFTPDQSCLTGESVIVAVLDTGVDAAHPDLADSILPNGVNMLEATFDVNDVGNNLDDDGDGRTDEMVGHGTHIAGTVLQVAPGAMILPVVVLNSDGVGDAFTLAAGIVYAAEQGANVINLSLGSTFDSQTVRGAIDFAVSQGVVVVAAVGNGDRETPAEFPAADKDVISVAATTDAADKAAYSNFHQTVEISAPGDNVASAYPDGLYTTASGTSMAVPIVAGSIALALEQQPSMTIDEISTTLAAAAGPLQLTDPAWNGKMGAGELDIDAVQGCSLPPAESST